MTYLLSVTLVSTDGTIKPRVLASSVTDPAGNTNAVANTNAGNTVTYQSPGVAYTPTGNGFISASNANAFPFSGTCSGQGTVYITGASSGSGACNSETWAISMNLSALADGNHIFYFDFTSLGGSTAVQKSAVITKDTVIPTVAITSPSAGTTINDGNLNLFTVSGTCSENGRAVIISGAVSGTTNCASSAWSVDLDFYPANNGTVTIFANHSDGVGNNATQDSESFSKNSSFNTTYNWTAIADGPISRIDHHAYWTGTEMIIWGGYDGVAVTNTGSKYNPLTDTWNVMNSTDQPSKRTRFCSAWTGQEMMIWGGEDLSYTRLKSGSSYNPSTNTWTALPAVSIPLGGDCAATWTGTYFAVATSQALRLYNPSTGLWTSAKDNDFPWLYRNTKIGFFGSKIFVYGKSFDSGIEGGIYDIPTNTWVDMNLTNSPPDYDLSTVLTIGSDLVEYGGIDPDNNVSQNIYKFNISTNTWTKIPFKSYKPRFYHTAVWTGTEMLVHGGMADASYNDPVIETESYSTRWLRYSKTLPGQRTNHSAIWAGDRMIIYGGTYSGSFGNGFSFKP